MIQLDSNNTKLLLHLDKLLKDNIYNNITLDLCPNCQSKNFIKYGKFNNRQRYLCKDCNKTFNASTNTMLYHSRKNIFIWIKYLNLILNRSTLRSCSDILNINLKTAFNWRHKILYSLQEVTEPNLLTNDITMSCLQIKENFKGSRDISTNKKRKVWIISASDTSGSILSKNTFLHMWDISKFNKTIYSKFDNSSYLHTFGNRYLNAIAKRHNSLSKIFHVNPFLNNYTYDFKISLKNFHGVATKYLDNYLSWLIIFHNNEKYSILSLLYSLSTSSNYSSHIKQKKKKIPYYF